MKTATGESARSTMDVVRMRYPTGSKNSFAYLLPESNETQPRMRNNRLISMKKSMMTIFHNAKAAQPRP